MQLCVGQVGQGGQAFVFDVQIGADHVAIAVLTLAHTQAVATRTRLLGFAAATAPDYLDLGWRPEPTQCSGRRAPKDVSGGRGKVVAVATARCIVTNGAAGTFTDPDVFTSEIA